MQLHRAEGAAVHAAPRLAGESPRDLKLRDRTCLIALLLGVALLWPLPLEGVLLMVAATFGLAISLESGLAEARPLLAAVTRTADNPPVFIDPDRADVLGSVALVGSLAASRRRRNG